MAYVGKRISEKDLSVKSRGRQSLDFSTIFDSRHKEKP
jgi:hypothetical protein